MLSSVFVKLEYVVTTHGVSLCPAGPQASDSAPCSGLWDGEKKETTFHAGLVTVVDLVSAISGEGRSSEKIAFKYGDSFPGYVKGVRQTLKKFSSFLSWEGTRGWPATDPSSSGRAE